METAQLIEIFNDVNGLDDPESPITKAIVQEFVEGAMDLSDGKLFADSMRDVIYNITRDIMRFGDALTEQGMTKFRKFCEHCGAGPADADGELPHYRDCQEA